MIAYNNVQFLVEVKFTKEEKRIVTQICQKDQN